MTHFIPGQGGYGKAMLMALLLSVLAACGGGGGSERSGSGPGEEGTVVQLSPADSVAARQREKRRQAAIDAREQEFTYFRYRIDTSQDAPLACFVFSAALDPEADYSPYVEFRPAFNPALSVEGRELCVGGLSFGTERTATLLSAR